MTATKIARRQKTRSIDLLAELPVNERDGDDFPGASGLGEAAPDGLSVRLSLEPGFTSLWIGENPGGDIKTTRCHVFLGHRTLQRLAKMLPRYARAITQGDSR